MAKDDTEKITICKCQNVFKQINNEVVGEFALVVSKFFQDHSSETKQTPMHFIAMVGNIKIANNYLRIN